MNEKIEISRDKKNSIFKSIETREEYNEAVKDKEFLVIISKDESFVTTLEIREIDKESHKIYFQRYDNDYIVNNFVWLDDRSPVGVRK